MSESQITKKKTFSSVPIALKHKLSPIHLISDYGSYIIKITSRNRYLLYKTKKSFKWPVDYDDNTFHEFKLRILTKINWTCSAFILTFDHTQLTWICVYTFCCAMLNKCTEERAPKMDLYLNFHIFTKKLLRPYWCLYLFEFIVGRTVVHSAHYLFCF